MSDEFESTKPEELTGFVCNNFIYTYDKSWQYELYVKNDRMIDYCIHTGIVGGRWVRDQIAHIVWLGDGVFKISWDEPTGTTVSVAFDLRERKLHGVIFFPQWIAQNSKKTVCFQNEHILLPERAHRRDAGAVRCRPDLSQAGDRRIRTITFWEDCAANDETIVAAAPSELPEGYASRRN